VLVRSLSVAVAAAPPRQHAATLHECIIVQLWPMGDGHAIQRYYKRTGWIQVAQESAGCAAIKKSKCVTVYDGLLRISVKFHTFHTSTSLSEHASLSLSLSLPIMAHSSELSNVVHGRCAQSAGSNRQNNLSFSG